MDATPHNREARMERKLEALAATFPCMQHEPAAKPWNALALEQRWHTASGGERSTISFLLAVWDHTSAWQCGKFTLDDFARWDREHQAAFVAWAKEPWWA